MDLRTSARRRAAGDPGADGRRAGQRAGDRRVGRRRPRLAALRDARRGRDPARDRRDPRRRPPARVQPQLLLPRPPVPDAGARGGLAQRARAVLPRVRPRHRRRCRRCRPLSVRRRRAPSWSRSCGRRSSASTSACPTSRCSAASAPPARASSRARRRVDEALWLEQRGVDAVIAQGLEAGGHRGHFLDRRPEPAVRHVRARAAARRGAAHAGDRRRRHRRPRRRRGGAAPRRGDGPGRHRRTCAARRRRRAASIARR